VLKFPKHTQKVRKEPRVWGLKPDRRAASEIEHCGKNWTVKEKDWVVVTEEGNLQCDIRTFVGGSCSVSGKGKGRRATEKRGQV